MFLCQSQCSLLALVTHVMMHTIQHCCTLARRDQKANTPSSSPLGVVLRYSSPLLKVKLLCMWKSAWLSSVSA